MKVAIYCRVSTDKDDQANSFEAQQRYFRDFIARNPGWELYGIYADEGISGTSTRGRGQFLRMIDDACGGRFSMIVTKEVSRFSRNIVDAITCTRDLKAMGVGVLFVNDGIHTLDPDAELRLSIMASIAQEESRKTSSRVVWGQTRQMEKGVVFGPSMLGYDVSGGKLSINEDGAELVRLIFHKYAAEQMGTAQIARFLTRNGCRTYRGSSQWKAGQIIKILKNEKYAGDLVQKKTYTPNYLTHEKKRNTGQVELIRIENHHEPIVSREIWDAAQERLRKNNRHTGDAAGHSCRYIFSGKIRCGQCGGSFVGHNKKRRDGTKIRRWRCANADRGQCNIGRIVRDDDAVNMLKIAVQNLHIDRSALADDVAALVPADGDRSSGRPESLRHEMDRIRKKKEMLLDRYLEGDIGREDMHIMNDKYDGQLAALRERLQKADDSPQSPRQLQKEVLRLLDGETVSEAFYKYLAESLTVFRDRRMELRLRSMPQVFCFA